MRSRTLRAAILVSAFASLAAGPTRSMAAPGPDGAALYAVHCARCHEQTQAHAPSRAALAIRSSTNIVMAVMTGAMRPEGRGLSNAEVNAIAAFLTADAAAHAVTLRANPCRVALGPLRLSGAQWNGWGRDLANTRFQPHAHLTAAGVAHLKLKWAFAYPGEMTWGQPTLVGGRVFVASTTGQVYALDARSGCTLWSLEVGTPVRTAITIGAGGPEHRVLAYFGDVAAFAHAVDADTGAEIWRVHVDQHPFARITGSPVLVGSRLLVPVSSFEEGAAADESYSCCTFRGSVVALDAQSGRLLWKHRTISGPLEPYHRVGNPTRLYGPAGGSVWNAPTVDSQRGVLYVGTGNDYTDRAASSTDAILAIDLANGKTRWARQLVANDNWAAGCTLGGPCPQPAGDDADFAASTILVRLASGHDVLVAAQKSGAVYGLDPSEGGKVLWKTKVGAGGVFGGIEWGMAAIGSTIYVPISDSMPTHPAQPGRPGLGALDAATGKLRWWAPAPSPHCAWGNDDCRAALSQAVSATPGIVLAGAQDGHLRAYDALSGKILGDFDTARPVPAVNAESAHGGSLDAGGPVIVDGTVYVNCGYGQFLGRGGNVLMALE